MIEGFVRDLQALRKADMVIGKIWLQVLLRRFGLALFAALIAVFALGMLNAAAFLGLQASVGPVQAALVVAAGDIVIAGLVLLLAMRTKPGPEIELAQQIRTMALDQLQADAGALRAGVAQLVHNPLDTAAEKLLVPAVLSLLRGLRTRKQSQ
jgi:hypothetical protein